jgi:hypothetical protein
MQKVTCGRKIEKDDANGLRRNTIFIRNHV